MINFNFGLGKESRNKNFILKYYNPNKKNKIDVLIFADSRGSGLKKNA